MQLNRFLVFQFHLFKRKKKTNILVCVTFAMKKQPLESILKKRCSFLLADDTDILLDFLVLEKLKTKRCRVDSCRSSIFKKNWKRKSGKFDCPIHQIKKCRKRKDSLGLNSFYINEREQATRCANN